LEYEHFEFVVEDPLTQHLVEIIYDYKGLKSAQLIGSAHICLNELEPGEVGEKKGYRKGQLAVK